MTGFQEMWDAVAKEGCTEVLAPGVQFVLTPKTSTVSESGTKPEEVREQTPTRKLQVTHPSKPALEGTAYPKDVPAEVLKSDHPSSQANRHLPLQLHSGSARGETNRSEGSSNPLKRSRRGLMNRFTGLSFLKVKAMDVGEG